MWPPTPAQSWAELFLGQISMHAPRMKTHFLGDEIKMEANSFQLSVSYDCAWQNWDLPNCHPWKGHKKIFWYLYFNLEISKLFKQNYIFYENIYETSENPSFLPFKWANIETVNLLTLPSCLSVNKYNFKATYCKLCCHFIVYNISLNTGCTALNIK